MLTTFSYVRSWMGVPAIAKASDRNDQLDSSEPDHYQPPQADAGAGIRQPVAVAIENARLYDETTSPGGEIQTLFTDPQAIAGRWSGGRVAAHRRRSPRLTSTRFSAVFRSMATRCGCRILGGQTSASRSVPDPAGQVAVRVGSRVEQSILIANVQTDPRVGMDMVQVMGKSLY